MDKKTQAIREALDGLNNFPLTEIQQSLINYLEANVDDIYEAIGEFDFPLKENEMKTKTESMLLIALKDLLKEIDLSKLKVRKDFSLLNAHAAATKAILKAEGKI